MFDNAIPFLPSPAPLWRRVAALFNPSIELPEREIDSALTRMRNLLDSK